MDLLFPLLIVALLIPMFLGMRRQKKAAAQTSAMQDSLTVGSRILTTAGLHATIVALGDDTVDLEIAPGIVTTWARIVVRERLDDDNGDLEDDTDAAEDSPATEESADETALRLNSDSRPRLSKDDGTD